MISSDLPLDSDHIWDFMFSFGHPYRIVAQTVNVRLNQRLILHNRLPAYFQAAHIAQLRRYRRLGTSCIYKTRSTLIGCCRGAVVPNDISNCDGLFVSAFWTSCWRLRAITVKPELTYRTIATTVKRWKESTTERWFRIRHRDSAFPDSSPACCRRSPASYTPTT